MINWFPGHMNKTVKQMQSDSKLCDCFIYVLDARCPDSCINPEFVKVVKGKPIVYVLNKADLVDKQDIQNAVKKYSQNGNLCVSLNATTSGSSKIIINAINEIFKTRIAENKTKGVNFILRAMILGVPNCGKSTIINNLCGKTRAVTGDKAGVTKSKLWVKVNGNIEFMDTPGVLLPTLDNDVYAYNLAFVGSIKDDVLPIVDVALNLIDRLKSLDCLKTRYGIDYDINTLNNDTLNMIAKKRGCVIKGGEIDLERASKMLLTDFRSGKLGKIYLE